MANKKRKLGGGPGGGNSRFPDTPGTVSHRHKTSKPNTNGPFSSSKQKQKQNQGQNSASRGGGAGQVKGKTKSQNKGNHPHHQQHHSNQDPVIPFEPHENILLIGEADLSFAACLATHYGCRNLTATVLEKSEAELLEKYPHASENISKVLRPEEDPGVGVRQRPEEEGSGEDGSDLDEEEEDKYDQDDDDDGTLSTPSPTRKRKSQTPLPNRNRILYNTDAKTLKAFTTKPKPPPAPAPALAPKKHYHQYKHHQRKQGLFHRIIFNFPHVGGKSTDVNRQVRHNQSLLVSFFERALPSLAPGGSVVVTLFEGEPYTLWNVRDLSRHAGLGVERSFRFPWGRAYPGYRHARTLGVVKRRRVRGTKGKNMRMNGTEVAGEGGQDDGGIEEGRDGRGGDDEEEGEKEDGHDDEQEEDDGEWEESTTAWRGEERAARSYVFKRKDEVLVPERKRKKRGAGSDSDSDSE